LLTPPDATTKLLGLLPSGFLHHFMITLDFSAKTVRFDASVGDAMKEAPTYFVTGIGLESSTDAPIHVAQVLSGSSAEEQGVLVGDEVVTVGGKDFATMAPYARPWSLMNGTLGAKITVTVKRADGTHDLALETRDLLVDP
jgi:C-terminal processing protease CtpA/Prc